MTTTSSTGPRIAPGARREVGLATVALARVTGRIAGTEPLKLFLTLGRHRRVFRGWLHWSSTLMPRGRLPRRTTELVILRVAGRRRCDYELDHHRRLGRRAGLTDAEIRAVTADDDHHRWSAADAVVLRAVDQLLERRDVDDETWASLAERLDERQLIELVLLVGQYDSVATTIAALRIERDQPRA